MKYIKLGNSDLNVSRICMGCMGFGDSKTGQHSWTYDAAAEQDRIIIRRAAEIAEKRGVSMTEISLAWLLTKVSAPVAGVTKLHRVEGAVKSVDIELTAEEIRFLEECYVPHKLVGVMAQNTLSTANTEKVWGK